MTKKGSTKSTERSRTERTLVPKAKIAVEFRFKMTDDTSAKFVALHLGLFLLSWLHCSEQHNCSLSIMTAA